MGGTAIGISPAVNLAEHIEKYRFPTEWFDVIIFTGFGRRGRNVVFVRSCDALILVSGRLGTLNEFTIACDEEKIVGVLQGSDGVSDMIPNIVKVQPGAEQEVIYDHEPRSLPQRILKEIT